MMTLPASGRRGMFSDDWARIARIWVQYRGWLETWSAEFFINVKRSHLSSHDGLSQPRGVRFKERLAPRARPSNVILGQANSFSFTSE